MNQVADILKLASTAQEQNVDAVLATVVRTEGSAYRRAGAMMLICADGRSVGMISGGCLEPHIIKRAFWLTRNGANVQVYQTGDEPLDENNEYSGRSDLESELNFGLGCNGKIHVLFERLKAALPFLDIIRHVRRTQQPAMIATLIRSDSNDIRPLPAGIRVDIETYINSGKLTIIKDDNISNQALIDASNPVTHALRETVEALSKHEVSDKNTEYVILKNEGLTTEWLLQRLQPQIRLLICGAGNDVMPLVTMAKLQDWHVTVIDSRAQYASRLRFPQADIVMPLLLDAHEKLLRLSENAAVALMSHSLTQDRARLLVLLEHSTHYKYLGQLGPRYRTERLINEINAVKKNPTALKEGISKLHYPIGYKLGGDGPEALALGIMAQITAVVHHKKSLTGTLETELSGTAAMSSIATLSCV
ncbi:MULTISPECIES: XdhC family protein [unclassified Psychrobacter]|uniref:XdhC family protein n=1 Tax=unclassified Psychrobacter TaxID=196806 RepID=UPI001787F668|nr:MULTISPECIES: XdhC/CoxI family protein [unclassified Psychrobacter]MBE0406406.1 XdhC family protein [Psychrobacter sp. FME6]MBE0443805.1 XdhC family protein [Psychrobacter sp. FME5]MDN5801424.1 XdhC family protein [Psychrobacter sp.]MDN5890776.1 XdhC family protein [Psychrobacter sp.]